MGLRTVHVTLAACVLLAGCAGSKYAKNPVWISGGINGLQQSACNCGGVETKKSFKTRRDAEARAQEYRRQNNEGGIR